MKRKLTLRNVSRKKENWLLLAMFTLLFVFGCYEFKLVDQPTEANTNSTFDVNIVMTEDDDDSNDWTLEDGSLLKTGLFGVLLPQGWTIQDSIPVRVESLDSISDGAGGWTYPSADHSADYVLAYSEGQTTMLNDSTPAPPPGYYWWGAETTEPVDMAFFDSLHFTLNIMTDDQTGEFYLQYAVGDVDYWGRMPYDPEVITDPLPITITPGVGINQLLREAAVAVYPNPSYGILNISLEDHNGQTVDLMIYDMRGKQVLSQKITGSQATLDLAELQAGAYMLRLASGEEAVTRKFVKY